MTPVGEVSFELERFEWTADDRLEVVGRWNGVRGRRIARPALTVDAGGRRQRVSGAQISDDGPDEPWRASFDWDASRGDPTGAELEIGRSLVVELPPPRRRRRRSAVGAENDLRAQVDELRGMVAELRAARARGRDRRARAAQLGRGRARPARGRARGRASRPSTADGAQAERERLEAALAESDAERSRLAAELEARESASDSAERARSWRACGSPTAACARRTRRSRTSWRRCAPSATSATSSPASSSRCAPRPRTRSARRRKLGELIRELQERAGEADRVTAELATVREELDALKHHVAQQEKALASAGEEAEKRLETERATTTEVHSRLAVAREEAQRTMVAEAEETERLRAELAAGPRRVRAAARPPSAPRSRGCARSCSPARSTRRARRPRAGCSSASQRDLERERATSRSLRRELDELRSDSAEYRRAVSSSTANGTLAMDEPPARAIRTPGGHAAPRRSGPRGRLAARPEGPAVAVEPVGGADRGHARGRRARHRARDPRLDGDLS